MRETHSVALYHSLHVGAGYHTFQAAGMVIIVVAVAVAVDVIDQSQSPLTKDHGAMIVTVVAVTAVDALANEQTSAEACHADTQTQLDIVIGIAAVFARIAVDEFVAHFAVFGDLKFVEEPEFAIPSKDLEKRRSGVILVVITLPDVCPIYTKQVFRD